MQIKRPDPHPPEHHDPANSDAPSEPQEEGALVSEPAACPFCVQPEFGVTYEPPPFRRGIVYANQAQHSLASAASAMSSTSSLGSQGLSSPPAPARRRATSLAATDSHVITTDRVRPDWAKKLADARAHALRRAAAATALHNAAYMMGNLQASDSRGFMGRRRRTMFVNDSPSSSGHHTPRRDADNINTLLSMGPGDRARHGSDDLLPGRQSSRRVGRLEDLEELMMMEAIRLSLAAEEERKRKEEKEAAKEAKKEEKKKAKEARKAEKNARKSGFFPHPAFDTEDQANSGSSSVGKGKAVDRPGPSLGFNPLTEPTSTLNASSSKDDPQRHLEQSRAQIQNQTSNSSTSPFDPFSDPPPPRAVLRSLSNASSSASSFAESYQGSLQAAGGFAASGSSFEPSPNASGLSLNREEKNSPHGTPGTEPMFNFRSLAAVITDEERKAMKDEGTDLPRTPAENMSLSDPESPESSTKSTPDERASEAMDESIATMKPTTAAEDVIEQAPPVEDVSAPSNGVDAKHVGEVSMVGSLMQEATQ